MTHLSPGWVVMASGWESEGRWYVWSPVGTPRQPLTWVLFDLTLRDFFDPKGKNLKNLGNFPNSYQRWLTWPGLTWATKNWPNPFQKILTRSHHYSQPQCTFNENKYWFSFQIEDQYSLMWHSVFSKDCDCLNPNNFKAYLRVLVYPLLVYLARMRMTLRDHCLNCKPIYKHVCFNK